MASFVPHLGQNHCQWLELVNFHNNKILLIKKEYGILNNLFLNFESIS